MHEDNNANQNGQIKPFAHPIERLALKCKKDCNRNGYSPFLVGVARLELTASWSRTMRATICATPRCSFFIIMITHTVVKYQFSFLQRNMRNLSILVFGRNVSFCYFHLDSIPESHYNKTTAVSPVLQTLLTTSLETVHCCQSPFFFLSMLRKYKNAATFVAAFLWWTIQDLNL